MRFHATWLTGTSFDLYYLMGGQKFMFTRSPDPRNYRMKDVCYPSVFHHYCHKYCLQSYRANFNQNSFKAFMGLGNESFFKCLWSIYKMATWTDKFCWSKRKNKTISGTSAAVKPKFCRQHKDACLFKFGQIMAFWWIMYACIKQWSQTW